jgi:hypothetical protein
VSRPALEVADIFRDHGAAWRKANAGHLVEADDATGTATGHNNSHFAFAKAYVTGGAGGRGTGVGKSGGAGGIASKPTATASGYSAVVRVSQTGGAGGYGDNGAWRGRCEQHVEQRHERHDQGRLSQAVSDGGRRFGRKKRRRGRWQGRRGDIEPDLQRCDEEYDACKFRYRQEQGHWRRRWKRRDERWCRRCGNGLAHIDRGNGRLGDDHCDGRERWLITVSYRGVPVRWAIGAVRGANQCQQNADASCENAHEPATKRRETGHDASSAHASVRRNFQGGYRARLSQL